MPEMAVRRAARRAGGRFRVCAPELPGKPDLVFTRARTAVFVHGCWWHAHSCAAGSKRAKSNRAYWRSKVLRNQRRDRRVQRELRGMGWRVSVLWECSIRDSRRLDSRLRTILERPAHVARTAAP
jgi:DNA mismatch endonuclease (patch repair protein)